MKFIFAKNPEEVAQISSQIFIDAIKDNPSIHLCLATGSTPVEMYQKLIESNKSGEISFKDVQTFNLDNYIGIPVEDENNYEAFMRDNLFDHIDLPKENWRVPTSDKDRAEKFCEEYEEEIDKMGIDLCLLGVGENGHIAFNEPADKHFPYTQIIDLTEETIEVNSRFFDNIEDVPTKAVTMGIGSIMKAKKIVLIATGQKKAPAMEKLYREVCVDPQFPISMLYLHPDVTIITDSIEA